jgi:threonine aldolase
MKPTKNFASDNNAGAHPEILKAIAIVNEGYFPAYGDDPYTASAVNKFREHFGPEIDVYFVFIGTAANVLGLKTVTESFNSIICAESAHINVDECGAPEKFIGCKLVTVPTSDGKLTVDQIASQLHTLENQHHNQPKVVSISQSTEYGTVYTQAEIRALAEFAHQYGLLLHVDGARIANAAASLNLKLKEITADAGVDLLSFGGTKNGLIFGEAVIFFNPALSRNFKFLRKQAMQLMSKMRFVAAQFEALLSNDLWLRNAQNANAMARLLAKEIAAVPGVRVTQKVEANAVFALIPPQFIPLIQEKYFFYVWNERTSEVRLMTAFDTTEEDVRDFVRVVREVVK